MFAHLVNYWLNWKDPDKSVKMKTQISRASLILHCLHMQFDCANSMIVLVTEWLFYKVCPPSKLLVELERFRWVYNEDILATYISATENAKVDISAKTINCGWVMADVWCI